MRRMHLVCAIFLGFGAMILGSGGTIAQTDGGVAFTIHAASCPLDYEGGIYEACHDNGLEGAVFTLTAEGMSTVEITTTAGVGEAFVLAGLPSADAAVLQATAPGGGWVYCKDQISGFVLADSPIPETGSIELGTLLPTQWVICDVYQYATDVAPAGPVSNG